jgi:hypothetical protein
MRRYPFPRGKATGTCIGKMCQEPDSSTKQKLCERIPLIRYSASFRLWVEITNLSNIGGFPWKRRSSILKNREKASA